MTKIIAIVGNSGSGKTTIAQTLASQGYGQRLITHTTRPKRDGEIDGVDYYFSEQPLTPEYFIETTEFASHDYGLSLSELEQKRKTSHVFFVCDIDGAVAIKRAYPNDVVILKINRDADKTKGVQAGRNMTKEEIYRRRQSDQSSANHPMIDFTINNTSETIQPVIEQIVYLCKLTPQYQDQPYLDLLQKILQEGTNQNDRTNTGVTHLYGQQLRFDLQKAFPLLTSKHMPFQLIASELLWFINGDTNIKYLLEHNNTIWNEWAFERYIKNSQAFGNTPVRADFQRNVIDNGLNATMRGEWSHKYKEYLSEFIEHVLNEDVYVHFNGLVERYGELGPVYGYQWRNAYGVDQLEETIREIKANPTSRRLIVNAWNPSDIGRMALPPCHTMYQFFVDGGRLHCHLYQRSGDMFLGVPFNIASYALLVHIVANECDLQVGELIHTIGDAHIYHNHLDQVREQLSRPPIASPALQPFDKKPFQNFKPTDFQLVGYNKHKKITAPVAV